MIIPLTEKPVTIHPLTIWGVVCEFLASFQRTETTTSPIRLPLVPTTSKIVTTILQLKAKGGPPFPKIFGMKIQSIILSLSILLISQSLMAKTSQSQNTAIFKTLKKMTQEYSSVIFLKSKFKHTQISELLGDKKKSSGTLYYSKNKLRLELQGELNFMTLVTPEVVWNVSYDSKNKKIQQVIKSKPRKHPLLELLFGNPNRWDDFKISEIVKNTSKLIDVILIPQKRESLPGISKVRFKVGKKSLKTKEVTYWDDIGNEIQITFTSNTFNKTLDDSLFTFTPPQGIQIKTL